MLDRIIFPQNSGQIIDFPFVSEFNGLPVESVDSEKQRPFCSERCVARADDDGGPARGPGPEDGGSAQWRPVFGEVREEVRARAKTAWIELHGLRGGGEREEAVGSCSALLVSVEGRRWRVCGRVNAEAAQGRSVARHVLKCTSLFPAIMRSLNIRRLQWRLHATRARHHVGTQAVHCIVNIQNVHTDACIY